MPPETLANPPKSEATDGQSRLIRLPAVLDLVGLGRSAWFDLVAQRKAPRPVHIGRAALWVESEVRAFIAARIRQSREVR